MCAALPAVGPKRHSGPKCPTYVSVQRLCCSRAHAIPTPSPRVSRGPTTSVLPSRDGRGTALRGARGRCGALALEGGPATYCPRATEARGHVRRPHHDVAGATPHARPPPHRQPPRELPLPCLLVKHSHRLPSASTPPGRNRSRTPPRRPPAPSKKPHAHARHDRHTRLATAPTSTSVCQPLTLAFPLTPLLQGGRHSPATRWSMPLRPPKRRQPRRRGGQRRPQQRWRNNSGTHPGQRGLRTAPYGTRRGRGRRQDHRDSNKDGTLPPPTPLPKRKTGWEG